MPKHTDITNLRFGRLIALHPVGKNKDRKITWLCRCDCGTEKVLSGKKLRNGNTTSCGCQKLDGSLRRVHGEAKVGSETPEYQTWKGMFLRTTNPKCKTYKYYGGRGITVCERWKNFQNFLADMGRKPSPKHTIDRINVNGNYEPGNCRWATRLEQNMNRRSVNDLGLPTALYIWSAYLDHQIMQLKLHRP
jgi:hypothetical protein